MIVDGEERGPQFDDVSNRIFSPDGRRVAYAGRRAASGWAATGRQGGTRTSSTFLAVSAFSSDSRRFAYAGADVHRSLGSQKAQGRAIVDGESGPQFQGNQMGSFKKSMLTATNVAIVEGVFSQLLSDIHGVTAPVFSPDGARVAYAVHRGQDDAGGDCGRTAGTAVSFDCRRAGVPAPTAGTWPTSCPMARWKCSLSTASASGGHPLLQVIYPS